MQFIGEQPPEGFPDALDRNNPITVGPYMNEPDYHQQPLSAVHGHVQRRRSLRGRIRQEYAALTGRDYPILDLYRMEDAEVAVFLLNSASEIIKDVVDQLREQGH